MLSLLPIFILSFIFPLSNSRVIDLQQHNNVNLLPSNKAGCLEIDNLYVAHFVDISGTFPYVTNFVFSYLPLFFTSICSTQRHIIGGVAEDYYPYPKNITDSNSLSDAQSYLNSKITYKGIFDLQTSVNSFLNQTQYSSFDSSKNIPPWAVIYACSDTVNGYNNFLNSVTKLRNAGFTVLVVSNKITRVKMQQYLQVLSMEEIANFDNINGGAWLINRINDNNYYPTENQTSYSGYITSPNYPQNYSTDVNKDYFISVPSNDYQIFLNVNICQLGSGDTLCLYQGATMNDDDFYRCFVVDIYEGKNFTITSNAVTLRFVSKNAVSYTNFGGFGIAWNAIPK